jgi:hypothetical protein
LLPHGTREARINHLAHGELLCQVCRELDPGYEPRHARGDRQEVATGA